MNLDFPSHIDSTGVRRSLNLIPSPPAFYLSRPNGIVLPPSEIVDFLDWPAVVKTKDQGQIGACTYHSAASGEECTRAEAGMTHVPLSPWYGYSHFAVGRNVGTSISEALEFISQNGLAPEETVPWGTIDPRYLSATARDAAPRFRIETGESLRNFDEILSAVALRQYCNGSIVVGNNFSSLDSEGVPPAYRGIANHAVCLGGGIKTSNRWGKLILMKNSWGNAWGDKGFCWLSRAHFDSSYFECYSVSAVYDDPQDTTNPPMVA